MHRDSETGFTVRASGFFSHSDNDYEVWGKFVTNTLPNGRSLGKKPELSDLMMHFRSFGSRTELGYTDVKWADNFMIGYTGSDTYKEVQHGRSMSTPYKGRFTESQAHISKRELQQEERFY